MIDWTCEDDIFYHQSQQKLNTILTSEGKMYHYTTVDVLQKIVSSRLIFATHINFMNDWQEYVLGYKKLTEAIKVAIEKNANSLECIRGEDKKYLLSILFDDCLNVTSYYENEKIKGFKEYRECLLPEVYSVSFCSSIDSLNQWGMYAKECGVAIEFDFQNFVLCDASLTNEDDYEEEDWQQIKYFRYNCPHKINYNENSLQSEMNTQINEVLRELANPKFVERFPTVNPKSYLLQEVIKLYSMVPYFKLDKFKGEDEIRLAFMRLKKTVYDKKEDEYKEFVTPVFYRENNHILKPYIKIGWEPTEEKYRNTYPIKRIMVGPGNNQEAVFRGIIHFIENQDKNVIPYDGKFPKFTQPFIGESYKTGNGVYIQKSSIPFIF